MIQKQFNIQKNTILTLNCAHSSESVQLSALFSLCKLVERLRYSVSGASLKFAHQGSVTPNKTLQINRDRHNETARLG